MGVTREEVWCTDGHGVTPSYLLSLHSKLGRQHIDEMGVTSEEIDVTMDFELPLFSLKSSLKTEIVEVLMSEE